MAECVLLKSGGGSGSDDCTALKSHTLAPYTVIANDTNDEPEPGTMVDLRNQTITLTSTDPRPVIVGAESWQTTNSDGTTRICIRGSKEGYIDDKVVFAIPQASAASILGLTSAKLLAGQNVCGVPGTATSGLTATAANILNGKTACVNGQTITGTMTVGSILSFSAAAYSTNQILLTWQNPYAATGRPFSGVFINYSTSGYPGTGGTRIYTGVGSNITAGGISIAIVSLPSAGTTYYFSCTAYASSSPNDLWGNTLNASAKTTSSGRQAITTSGTFTVPAGVRSINIFAVGGGGKGGSYTNTFAYGLYGGGGAGGYTAYKNAIAVNPGDIIDVIVGAGATTVGSKGNTNRGGTSSASKGATILVSAAGGYSAAMADPVTGGSNNNTQTRFYYGGDGGSGGGNGAYSGDDNNDRKAGNGGSDGGNGGSTSGNGGQGQGTTTREFGAASGTLYAGGGGGGGNTFNSGWAFWAERGLGGSGGGGNGGYYAGSNTTSTPGTPGSGGGGGGAGWYRYGSTCVAAQQGGSGAIVITW